MNGNNMKASGKSSSQRSIYDYPEHLNPFYEDEHHKRLRFWKIGSDKSSRSNSFSLDGLKGFWSFKSFKLKKKSSTLGINKTSESPPLLRRDEYQYECQTTFDGRMRHTIDIGLGNNFQRGEPYRSSLQDLNSTSRNQGESFFIRNSQYRSTAQVANSNVSHRKNITYSRPGYNQSSVSRGSSLLSVNSTNPFDDEYETLSEIGSPDRHSIRQSGRKKRRAPPPPSPNKREDTIQEPAVKCNDIVNLTAEIESFVRTADTDKETITSEQEATYQNRQSPENNDYYPQDHFDQMTIEKIQNLGAIDINSNERCKKSPVKIFIRAPTDEESSLTDEEMKSKFDCENSEHVTKDAEILGDGKSNVHKIEEMRDNLDASELDLKCYVHNKELKENSEVKICQIMEEKTTSTSSAVEIILENENQNDENNLTLKIIESNDDLTKINYDDFDKSGIQGNDVYGLSHESRRFEVNAIPLRCESPNMRRIDLNGAIRKVPPTPPQRRRSVKEIIESINKCQSLLKVNQNIKTNKSETSTFEKKHQNNHLSEVNNNTENIPLVVQKFYEFNNNVECKWNPVPKPRRHKATNPKLL